ncbi:hypothetical protein [Aureispira sp. CCB-QB1]|uniref:hypothetical protein n=1 Tax=Aureispira sp. CCB-QB1 TaxID=1313421 RepID=UPI000698A456|nr:hypothetical protein [Aureispira sp. CCB-QB1]
MSNELRWIDKHGNLLEGSQYIGFYDSITQTCELYDGTSVVCPSFDSSELQQKVVRDKPTYYWVLLVLFCLLVLFIAWYINR